MVNIFIKELNSFLNSLIAYIIVGVFLIVCGLLLWVFPETSILNYGYSDLSVFFNLTPYVFIFLVPAITMRTFSEEKKAGTMELLFTKPLTDWDIILGKFLATLVIIFFALCPTLLYFLSVYQLGNPVGNIDVAGATGSYIGLFLLGGAFASIGILASTLSENQVISFIIGAFFCFILYQGFGSLATVDIWGTLSYGVEQLGIQYHYSSLSKGLIDSRDLTYFLSVTIIMLLLTKLVLSSRKW